MVSCNEISDSPNQIATEAISKTTIPFERNSLISSRYKNQYAPLSLNDIIEEGVQWHRHHNKRPFDASFQLTDELHKFIGEPTQLRRLFEQVIDCLLKQIPGDPGEPFGDFLAAVLHLAANDAGPDGKAANDYLQALSSRREIVATSSAKYEALGRFAPSIGESAGTLLFTETARAAKKSSR